MITPINNSTPLGIRLPKRKSYRQATIGLSKKKMYSHHIKKSRPQQTGIAHHYSLIPVHHFISTAFDAFLVTEVCFTAVRRLAAS